MLAQGCLKVTTNPILKTKGKIKLLPSSTSFIEVRVPDIPDPNNIYELDFDTFQLPKGVICLDVMHCMYHKTPQMSKIPILNTNNTVSNLGENSPIATLVLAGRCKQIKEVEWLEVNQEQGLSKGSKLLPKIHSATNLQLEPNTNDVVKSIPDAVIHEVARKIFPTASRHQVQ